MKLIRCGAAGAEQPGLLLVDGTRVSTAAVTGDYDEAFFASGGLSELRRWAARDAAGAPRLAAGSRLGPPITRPSKIVCSEFMTLQPGGVISAGPAGVGLGMKPQPVDLAAGDLVDLGIDGLGTSRQRVVSFRPALVTA